MIVKCKKCKKKFNKYYLDNTIYCEKCKKKNRILPWMILFIFIFIFKVCLVSASIETIGTVKQNDCISLPQSCSDCTYNNITSIQYPNKTKSFIQLPMTKQGTEYNYTFCSTSAIGQYIISGKGDVNGTVTVWAYDFYVTTTGDKVSLSNIISVIAFLCIAGMFFLLGTSFDKTKWILKSGFYIFALFMGLIAVNSARIIASESLGLSTMTQSGLILTIIVISLMSVYILILWTIETFKSVKDKQGVRWNY